MINKRRGNLKSIERSSLGRMNKRPVRNLEEEREYIDEVPRRPSGGRSRRSKRFFGRIWTVLIAVILILIFLLSTLFSSAKISLVLASDEINFDGVFNASREPLKDHNLRFTVREFTKTKEAEISKFEKITENTKAEGTITIYNTNTSGEPLDIINRSRFQTEDGKLYRLIGKQVIPGGKTVDGKFVPGKKEVRVEANNFGDEYNLFEKGVRFTIPGLASYKEFADSYAISETKIVGGFMGEKFVPDEEEEAEVRKKIRKEVEEDLRAQLTETLETNTLSSRVIFEGGIFITFEDFKEENRQTENSVYIKEKGVMKVIMFREKNLAQVLATYADDIAPTDSAPTSISTEDISLEITNSSFQDDSKKITFRLKGTGTLYWSVDELLLKNDIAGQKRGDVDKIIIERYSSVIDVDNAVKLFPIWLTKIPKNKNKIELEQKHALINEINN